MNVAKTYKKLLKTHGPQGWWPIVKIQDTNNKIQNLRFEFKMCYGVPYHELEKYRTRFRDPYFEIAVGAILTQNTAWRNVGIAINNLYNAKTLTPKRIAKMNTRKLESIIRPAGYFRQKTKKLKLFSRWLIDEHGDDIVRLKKYKIHGIRDKLLQQWGIGKETADSILLYALNKPIFVVDEYTRRLCKEHGIVFKEYDQYRELFEKKLQAKAEIYREYHALIVQWGKERKNVV